MLEWRAPGAREEPFPLRGRDILCLSSIDWDFIWQGHQHVMSALAAEGNRVLFVENTGVRRPRLSDLPRIRQRLANWWRGTRGFRQEAEGLFVFSPVMLPFPYSRLARWVNRTLLRRALRRWMRAAGFGRPIVWTFLPTPIVLDLITEFDPLLTVYYCIDDLAHSSPAARRVRDTEPALFGAADLVFVTSEKLRLRARERSDAVHVFPFGVDLPRFERVREAPGGVPAEIARLPRPVAGYVGGVHRWIDQPLLCQVAKRLPHVSFALVGPIQTDVEALRALPNVHLLGPRAHEDLPACLKGFDLGLIPYRRDEYTDNVYPTKLNEYLAMGLPVVSTDLPEVRRYDERHERVLSIAAGADAFASAVEAAAADRTPASAARRIEAARSNAWERRVREMATLVAGSAARRDAVPRAWRTRLEGLYRRGRRRVGAAALAAGLLYFGLFQTSLVFWAAAPLRLEQRPVPADAILVLAGGTGEGGDPGRRAEDRVLRAVELYQRGLAPRIVFSSPLEAGFRETEVMRTLAMMRGVPAEAILLEDRPRNTHEHAVVLGALAAGQGWRRVLLVSSPYHMRRAVGSFRRAHPKLQVVATPVQRSVFWAVDGGPRLDQLSALVHEVASLAYYAYEGYV